MRPYKIKCGHLRVTLTKNGRSHYKAVHRLVLETFVGACPKGKECCHIDDSPQNNSLPNLYWGSRSQNVIDAFRNGKRDNKGEKHSQARLNKILVSAIKVLQNSKQFTSKELSYLFNVCHDHINAIKYGKSWKDTK